MKVKRILNRHIGRSMDWRGAYNQLINGRIVKVQNRIATVEYYIAGKSEPFTHWLEVDSPSIVEIY